MAAPTFVTAGAIKSQAFGASIQPALPASRVNGNLLICQIGFGAADKTATFPAGWTDIGTALHNGSIAVQFAARIVDGTETDPSITWTGNTSAKAKIWQYSGNLNTVANAIGNTAVANANNSTFTNPGLSTTAANSLVVCFWYGNNGTVTGTPTNYTSETSESNMAAFDETIASNGGSSDAISNALSTTMQWRSHEFEIRSEAAGISGTGALVDQSAAVAGTGVGESTGTGSLAAQSAAVSGSGTVGNVISGSGALTAQAADVTGNGTVQDPPPILPAVVIMVVNR